MTKTKNELRVNHSLRDWQDAYYDGNIAEEDLFCETKQIVARNIHTDLEEVTEQFKTEEEYWEACNKDSDNNDDHYIWLKNLAHKESGREIFDRKKTELVFIGQGSEDQS